MRVFRDVREMSEASLKATAQALDRNTRARSDLPSLACSAVCALAASVPLSLAVRSPLVTSSGSVIWPNRSRTVSLGLWIVYCWEFNSEDTLPKHPRPCFPLC
jgi:hypothetical protein